MTKLLRGAVSNGIVMSWRDNSITDKTSSNGFVTPHLTKLGRSWRDNALEWNERVYFSRSWHVTPAEHARHVTSAVCLRCMPAVMAYWEMQLFSCFLIHPWIRTLIRSLHFLYRKSLNSLNRFSSIFSFIYTWYMNLLFILNIKTLGSLFSGGCTGNFSYYRLWTPAILCQAV